MLLVTTSLTPVAAWAQAAPDGAAGTLAFGVGNQTGGNGAPGGNGTVADQAGGTGGAGGSATSLAGDATGGQGGSGGNGGANAAGGAGGVGGEADALSNRNANGGSGGNAGNGGNGSAGSAGTPAATGSIVNTTTLTGGTGGAGSAGGVGGAGGDGGVGSSNTADNAVGGAGGNGGNAGAGGAGGAGGAAISASGVTITNSGTLQGGAGGAGGAGGMAGAGGNGGAAQASSGTAIGGAGGFGGNGGNGGAGGAGSAAITGSDLTVINSGTISPGAGGTGGAGGSRGAAGAGGTAVGSSATTGASGFAGSDGFAGANGVAATNAITFTGGTNVLELQAGSTITGNVVAFSAADTLRLGGTGTGTSFDVSQIGAAAQYRNFGVFEKAGTGTWALTGTTASTTNWAINGGTLAISADNNLGAGAGTVSLNGGTLQTTSAVTSSRGITLGAGGGTFQTDAATSLGGVIGGSGGLTKTGTGTLTLTGTNTYTGATTVDAGTLALVGDAIASSTSVTLAATGTTLDATDQTVTIRNLSGVAGSTVKIGAGLLKVNVSPGGSTYAGTIEGTGTFDKLGSGTLTVSGSMTNSGTSIIDGGTLQAGATNAFSSSSTYRLVATTLDLNNFDNTIGQLEGTGTVSLGTATLTVGGNSSYGGQITGTGGLTLDGGSYSIGSTMAYTGATTVQSGTLSVTSLGSMASSSGLNLAASGATFNISTSSGITIKDLTGVAGSIVNLGSEALTVGTANDTTFAGVIGGSGGSLVKQGSGQLTLSGANTYTGATTVSAGRLAVNGSLTSAVTVDVGGNLGGTGTITGNVTTNGTISPGNSIGTLNITGTYTQAAGSTYSVEVNPAGQSDRIDVTGNAVINGGTVSVQAAGGTYARNTQYTILTASGGRTGTYSAVTSNLAFLTPSLTYDANDVFLTLVSTSNSFRNGSQTSNQAAVGTVLDNNSATATGDFGNVLNAMFGLNTTDGAKALNTLSGQPIANFGTTNVQTGMGFLNAVGGMMGGFHHGFGGKGQHVSMAAAEEADACDVACDLAPLHQLGAWISGVGGFGSVLGNSNAGALTYNFGGTAVGMDYAVTPDLRVGVGAGYTSGTQWVGGFDGRSTTDAFSGFLYASYSPSAFYLDGVAGYAYANNRSTRTIAIPGLAPRTALGSTGANQFLGQVETGYRLDLVPSALAVTPFARMQGSTTTQNGFTEAGADSLNLTVAGQTTNSLRTTLGADLSAEIARMAFGVRLGWQHEHADTGRPMTASFAGAPGQAFTVTGATPQRDSAVVGFSFNTHVAETTELYARYDGEVGGGSDNHAFTAGLRMTW